MLKGLTPGRLDTDLLDRLEAAAHGDLHLLDPASRRLEESLASVVPAPLPAPLMANLEAILSETPFPVDDKIVLFPKSAPAASLPRASKSPLWSAAAAVALLGASAALFVPRANHDEPAVSRPAVSSPLASRPSISATRSAPAGNFVPAAFDRGVDETRDEGLYWESNTTPHRVVKVVYKDRLLLKNENGETIEVVQPRTQYILVPEKAD